VFGLPMGDSQPGATTMRRHHVKCMKWTTMFDYIGLCFVNAGLLQRTSEGRT
jgi:hypothetical protein